jgi:hypothetical protein
LVHDGVLGAEPKLLVRNDEVLVGYSNQSGQNNFFENFANVGEEADGAIILGEESFPGLAMKMIFAFFHRKEKSQSRRLALMIVGPGCFFRF